MKLIRINRTNFIFFLGLLLIDVKFTLGYMSSSIGELPDLMDNVILIIAIMLFLICIICKYKPEYIIGIILITILLYANFIITNSPVIITLFVTIFASKNISYKKIFGFQLKFYVTILLIVIFIYVIKMSHSSIDVTYYRIIGQTKIARYSFFFNQPNMFSMLVFYTSLLYFYLRYDKCKKRWLYLNLVIVGFAVYYFPNTQTVTLLFAVLILLDVMNGYLKKHTIEIIYISIYWAILLCSMLFVFLWIYMPNNSLVNVINKATSGRIFLWATALKEYGMKFMGNNLLSPLTNQYDYLVIDNAYWSLVIIYGISISIIIIYIYGLTLRKIGNDKKSILVFIVMLIYGFTEAPGALNIWAAFPLFFIRESINKRCSNDITISERVSNANA